jgi:thioredoxin 1
MKLTSEELQSKIDSGEKFIVDLYADWCGPCRMMGPIIDKVSNQLKEDGHEVSVYKFNIEEDKEMAVKLGVRSIPAIKGFNGGENVTNKVGMISESQLMEMVKEVL